MKQALHDRSPARHGVDSPSYASGDPGLKPLSARTRTCDATISAVRALLRIRATRSRAAPAAPLADLIRGGGSQARQVHHEGCRTLGTVRLERAAVPEHDLMGDVEAK